MNGKIKSSHFLFRRYTSKFHFCQIFIHFQNFPVFQNFPSHRRIAQCTCIIAPKLSGRPCQIFCAATNELRISCSCVVKFFMQLRQLQNSTELGTWQLRLPNFSKIPNFSSSCAAGKLHKNYIIQPLKFCYFTICKKS